MDYPAEWSCYPRFSTIVMNSALRVRKSSTFRNPSFSYTAMARLLNVATESLIGKDVSLRISFSIKAVKAAPVPFPVKAGFMPSPKST